MDFVTVSTGLILPYWMGLPIRYIHLEYKYKANLLCYEKNLYLAKQSGFKGFAFRCERFM